MTLCYECRKWLREKYRESYYVAPYQHCHHDTPGKKPLIKCQWCEDYKEFMQYEPQLSGAASFTSQNKLWLLAHYMIGAGKIIENCPMCGVKLTGE